MDPSRNDIETTSSAGGMSSHCPVCQSAFTRVRRQRYCSSACRQAAWRSRRDGDTARLPAIAPAPPRRRRDVTVYRCGECDQRYLAEQWCPDCQRPCTREGPGGLCPHCDEPVTIDDLLPPQHHQTEQR